MGENVEPVPEPPLALLRGVAALVTAVEELEAGRRGPGIPKGLASVTLARLLSTNLELVAAICELDRLAAAAGIDTGHPRWAADALEARRALDRLVRYPERRFDAVPPAFWRHSAVRNLAADQLRRGEGDAVVLERILERMHGEGDADPRVPGGGDEAQPERWLKRVARRVYRRPGSYLVVIEVESDDEAHDREAVADFLAAWGGSEPEAAGAISRLSNDESTSVARGADGGVTDPVG